MWGGSKQSVTRLLIKLRLRVSKETRAYGADRMLTTGQREDPCRVLDLPKTRRNPDRKWWARQGLNLRPHPCEGSQPNQIVSCFGCENSLLYEGRCTRFVREGLWRPSKTCRFGRIAAATEAIARPPDQIRKTAGRAATLASGHFNSVAATRVFYAITESRASIELAGGAS